MLGGSHIGRDKLGLEHALVAWRQQNRTTRFQFKGGQTTTDCAAF
jgi:hypothetical protein